MVQRQATKKVLGGKLVRVKITIEDTKDTIESIKIYGDFFLYPEDSINILEEALIGIDKDISLSTLQQKISDILNSQKAHFIGLESTDLASLIIEALQST